MNVTVHMIFFWFTGIHKIRDEFSSWEWLYGKTPLFEVNRNYDIGWGLMQISMKVETGLVKEVHLELPEGVSWGSMTGRISLATFVQNQRFTPEAFTTVENALKQQKLHSSVNSDRRQAARA